MHLLFVLASKQRDIYGSLCLIVRSSVVSKKGLIHQPPIPDLFKIATRGNIQVSVEEYDLLKGFIKTLSILLSRLPVMAFIILSLSLERVFELSHFSGIKVLMLFGVFS